MTDRRITHGKCPRVTQPKKYTAWCNLKRRCNDPTHPAFKDYGGRGITFHPPWNDFARFDADVPDPPAPNLTLDRIRNNEGYIPGNVQWADRTAQMFQSSAGLAPGCNHTTVKLNLSWSGVGKKD